MNATRQMTLGVIIGNRGFFPKHLCTAARNQVLELFAREGIQAVILDESGNPGGSVETLQDSHRCADLFSENREKIDGILVTLPNFGDERAIANTLRWSRLDVPVLVHAFPDDKNLMQPVDRRDSFCGKISVCNNLRQYGIKYSLTSEHVEKLDSRQFTDDLDKFLGICRLVKGLKGMRIGLVGARPAAFNTVRFSEVLLERSGISIEPIDLSEIINRAVKKNDHDPEVVEKMEKIGGYLQMKDPPAESMKRMAKLGAVLDQWMADQELSAIAIQCWTALEEVYGIVPCTLLSMMSNSLVAAACETDVTGAIGMIALSLASGKPSGIVDWNNNFGDDLEKCVIFHCSNLPKELLNEGQGNSGQTKGLITTHGILSNGFGKENTWGAVAGRLKTGGITFCRVSSDDLQGKIRAYAGEGEITPDPLETFGGYGVLRIKGMSSLLKKICDQGFEHHVAINYSNSAATIHEAFTRYLEWDTYLHSPS